MQLLPANGDLTTAEINLLEKDNAPDRLRVALAPVVWDFDVILIDCPPALDMLTVNALTQPTRSSFQCSVSITRWKDCRRCSTPLKRCVNRLILACGSRVWCALCSMRVTG